MKKQYYLLLVALMLNLVPNNAFSEVTFKGLMFGEYYLVLNHNSGEVEKGGIEGRHGFWFRRIYFTSEAKLTDNIKMRLRLEMQSPGSLPFDSSAKLEAYVKDAYLSYKTGGHELILGIQASPTFGHTVGGIWGYRHLEKTPLDLTKLRTSRDFGITLKGTLDKIKSVSYMVMFANGASVKGETDKGKIVYGALSFKPVKGLIFEVYGDYETRKDNKTYYTYQGFAACQGDWGRIGVLYARQHLKQAMRGEDDKENDYDIISAFAVVKVNKKMDAIARFDRMFGNGFESNFKGTEVSFVPFAKNPGAAFNFIIAGISWNAAKNLWLIPNIKYVLYGDPDKGDKPDTDAYGNLTFYFKF
ncbi:hypothetical protein ACFLRM_05200 [Acidobacteriota bacterium]